MRAIIPRELIDSIQGKDYPTTTIEESNKVYIPLRDEEGFATEVGLSMRINGDGKLYVGVVVAEKYDDIGPIKGLKEVKSIEDLKEAVSWAEVRAVTLPMMGE